jgi:aspartate racemase
MRVIGILGGMSWESTALYYNAINTEVKSRLGGLHSAELVMYSLDFSVIEDLQHKGDWDGAGAIMAEAGRKLAAAGAEAILIATNTMHKRADDVEQASGLPILHIADATGEAIARAGLKCPLLLATAFTMEQDFYKSRLEDRFGLEVVIPNKKDRATVHRVIYDELCRGHIHDSSRQAYRDIIAKHQDETDCVILGCTEITMLIGAGDCPYGVFDTTALHAKAAVDFALTANDRER